MSDTPESPRPDQRDEDDALAADEPAVEDADRMTSVAALASLPVGRPGLEDLLTEVVTFAVRAIPGADGAGLTLIEQDRQDTVVTTAPFVKKVDDIQYRIGQGPCVSATAERQTVRSGSLGGDPRWPRFGARVARLGVHSAVSMTLIAARQSGGSAQRVRPQQAGL